MILIETDKKLYGISKIIYCALKSQKPETELILKFENERITHSIKLFDDDEVQIIDDYFVRKSSMNDYEIIELDMFDHIEILTLGE